jgi:plastocyanin|tara:strand:+ start:239 stop:727 length:489 start_codon:yes stop_codon:yes gene_type:complete
MRTAIGVMFLAFFLTSSATITQAQTIQEEGEVVVVSVDSTNLRFSPETVTITEGDSVRFFWSGELLAHNAVGNNNLFDSGDPSRNVDYTFTFQRGTNGTFQYVCEPHEDFGMVGTIIVNAAPNEEMPPIGNNSESDSFLSGFASIIAVSSLIIATLFTRSHD